MNEAGFSGTKAATIVGITYRQLDYWARTDLIRPSLADASGSGSRRLYSYRDLLELRVIKSLLDAGIKLESVRTAFEYLRTHVDTDIASAHLVISGNDVILCDGDQLIDVMRRSGQGVLNVLAIGGVKSDLDSTIVELDRRRRRPLRPAAPCDECAPSTSPLDAVHRALGAKMVPFGGWEMPLAYPMGTIDEHLACRNDAVVFDVSHLGTVRVRGADADRRAAVRVDQRPAQDRPGSGAVHPPARRERRLGARRHHRVVDRRRPLRRHAQRHRNTDRVRAAIGGRRDHPRPGRCSPCRARSAKERLATVFPEAAAVGRFRVATATWQGHDVRRRRHRLHGRGGRRDRRAQRRRHRPVVGHHSRRHHAGRARRARHAAPRGRAPAARPRARSRHHQPAGRPRLGRGLVEGRLPRPQGAGGRARRGRRHASSLASPRTAAARRGPTATCSSTGNRSARSPAATSRRCSATASPWRSCLRTPRSAPPCRSTCGASQLGGPRRADTFRRQALISASSRRPSWSATSLPRPSLPAPSSLPPSWPRSSWPGSSLPAPSSLPRTSWRWPSSPSV